MILDEDPLEVYCAYTKKRIAKRSLQAFID
jgi:hypothetical protein